MWAMIRRAVPASPKMVVRYVKATSGIVFRAKPTGISEPNHKARSKPMSYPAFSLSIHL
jgi:hypothetical protein